MMKGIILILMIIGMGGIAAGYTNIIAKYSVADKTDATFYSHLDPGMGGWSKCYRMAPLNESNAHALCVFRNASLVSDSDITSQMKYRIFNYSTMALEPIQNLTVGDDTIDLRFFYCLSGGKCINFGINNTASGNYTSIHRISDNNVYPHVLNLTYSGLQEIALFANDMPADISYGVQDCSEGRDGKLYCIFTYRSMNDESKCLYFNYTGTIFNPSDESWTWWGDSGRADTFVKQDTDNCSANALQAEITVEFMPDNSTVFIGRTNLQYFNIFHNTSQYGSIGAFIDSNLSSPAVNMHLFRMPDDDVYIVYDNYNFPAWSEGDGIWYRQENRDNLTIARFNITTKSSYEGRIIGKWQGYDEAGERSRLHYPKCAPINNSHIVCGYSRKEKIGTSLRYDGYALVLRMGLPAFGFRLGEGLTIGKGLVIG